MTGLPEEMLRRIWETRITSTNPLTTSTGLPLTVLETGTPNENAGPDFLNALVRIGTRTYRGDVEVHTVPDAWYAHHHNTDPHYNGVVLHVVGSCSRPSPQARTESRRPLPLLILDRQFADLSALARQIPPRRIGDDAGTLLVRLRRSRCPRALLKRKGWQRLGGRVQRLEYRLHQLLAEAKGILIDPLSSFTGHPDEMPFSPPAWTGREMEDESIWEQLFYEGVMEALGYSRNAGAFLALARNVPLAAVRSEGRDDPEDVIALLFGAAGLIPPLRVVPEKESRRYVRRIRKRWRALGQTLRVPRLHAADWLFFRLRPANFPPARLAACASLMQAALAEEGFKTMRAAACAACRSPRRRLTSLRGFFRCEPQGYWRNHLHFRGGVSRSGAVLGRERIDVILLNCVLPLLIVYGRSVGHAGLERAARSMLTAMPSIHETRTLERVRRFFFPKGGKRLSALEQQGVLLLLGEERTDGRGNRKDTKGNPRAADAGGEGLQRKRSAGTGAPGRCHRTAAARTCAPVHAARTQGEPART